MIGRFILFCFLLPTLSVFAQKNEQNARNGWAISPKGRLHVLQIFVEIEYDSIYADNDPKPADGQQNWRPGKLPSFKDRLFDAVPNQSLGKGFLTKYFRQASFGQFEVTGEYYSKLITLKQSEIRNKSGNVVIKESFGNNYFRKALIEKINSTPFRTNKGSTIEDFDNWTLPGPGFEKTNEPDGKFDMVMIIWRNANLKGLKGNTGYASKGTFGKIHDVTTNTYSMFGFGQWSPRTIIRHEFSHLLYGGNNFHTAGCGVGRRTFLTPIGGWSNMSDSDRASQTWNGWDRERMGWKNPEHEFMLSARCAVTGKEANGSLEYGQEFCNKQGTYILRDFISSGDVIKIKLPFVGADKQNQYLWLENHQLKTRNLDHGKKMSKGIYAYIQVGKDALTGPQTYSGNNNYLWPLVAEGRYDFIYEPETKHLEMRSDRQNPLTGHNYIARGVYDSNQNGDIRVGSDGPTAEGFFPMLFTRDGVTPPEDYFNSMNKPVYGTSEIPFRADKFSKIGISYNPAATPLMSFSTPGRAPQSYDNRSIYLNGISVEVLEQDTTGAIKVKIRWDDFDIVQNLRWCGDIILKEKVRITNGHQIVLDQGYSAQHVRAFGKMGEENIFAAPTLLELKPGSELILEDNAELRLLNGSGILIRKGAKVTLGNNARIVVEEGSRIQVEEDSEFSARGKHAGVFYSDASVGVPENLERGLGTVSTFFPPPRLGKAPAPPKVIPPAQTNPKKGGKKGCGIF